MGVLNAEAVFGLSPDEGYEMDGTADSPEMQPEDEADEGYLSEDEGAEPEAQEQEATPQPLLAGKYKDVKDLENAYVEAQRLIGTKATEASEYKKQLDEYNNQLMQMLAYQQAMAMQQQQMQTQQQTVPPSPPEPQYDPDQLMTEWYSDPAGVVNKLVQPQIEKAVQERMAEFYNAKLPELGQLVGQFVEPIYKQAQYENVRQQKAADVQSMRQKYEDFDSLRGEISAIIDQTPQLAQLDGGLELAYRAAKANHLMTQVQATQAAQQNQQLTAEKKAAGMAGSAKVPQKQQNPTEQLLKDIFGNGKAGGVFG